MAALFFSFVLSSSFLNLPSTSNPKHLLQYFPDWTQGVVVLETGDTVACTLRYNQMVSEGLLQVIDGQNILTLSVKDVKGFFFYDATRKRHRQFYTLMVPLNTNVRREMFLEYIYSNERVSILNHKTMDLAHSYMEVNPFKQLVPVNKQYLLNFETGDLTPLSQKSALSLLQSKPRSLRYIRENDIRFKKLSDYIRVFEYDSSR